MAWATKRDGCEIIMKIMVMDTSSMTDLRFIPENNKGVVGPATATASEKRLAINPAVVMLKC